MVEEYIHGQMDVNMKENTSKIKNKGMVFISGQMEEVFFYSNLEYEGYWDNGK